MIKKRQPQIISVSTIVLAFELLFIFYYVVIHSNYNELVLFMRGHHLVYISFLAFSYFLVSLIPSIRYRKKFCVLHGMALGTVLTFSLSFLPKEIVQSPTFGAEQFCDTKKKRVQTGDQQVSDVFDVLKNSNPGSGQVKGPSKKKKKKVKAPPPCIDRQAVNALNPQKLPDKPTYEPWLAYNLRKAKYLVYGTRNKLLKFSFEEAFHGFVNLGKYLLVAVEYQNFLPEPVENVFLIENQISEAKQESLSRYLELLFYSSPSYAKTFYRRQNTRIITDVDNCSKAKRHPQFQKIRADNSRICRVEKAYLKYLKNLPLHEKAKRAHLDVEDYLTDEDNISLIPRPKCVEPAKLRKICFTIGPQVNDEAFNIANIDESAAFSQEEKFRVFLGLENRSVLVAKKFRPETLQYVTQQILKKTLTFSPEASSTPFGTTSDLSRMIDIQSVNGMLPSGALKSDFVNKQLVAQKIIHHFRQNFRTHEN